MKKPYLLLSGILGIIILLSVVQISLSNILSTGGIQIATMQEELLSYQKENAQLKEQIYSLASLTHITDVASGQGYVKETATAFVLDNPTPLAIKP